MTSRAGGAVVVGPQGGRGTGERGAVLNPRRAGRSRRRGPAAPDAGRRATCGQIRNDITGET
ncbi:hypothetical protein ABT341_21345, partial [Pseudonocardia alni]|uniref:hypothetical protein n=1 Tax=Pseudonocardia alni TaxID=33907 RepID=UPI00333466AC